jgi:hypothetical protein
VPTANATANATTAVTPAAYRPVMAGAMVLGRCAMTPMVGRGRLRLLKPKAEPERGHESDHSRHEPSTHGFEDTHQQATNLVMARARTLQNEIGQRVSRRRSSARQSRPSRNTGRRAQSSSRPASALIASYRPGGDGSWGRDGALAHFRDRSTSALRRREACRVIRRGDGVKT